MEPFLRAWLILALVASFVSWVLADTSIPIAYCASINTGTTAANSSLYQSDGLCYNFCNDQSYALAIVQGETCWCSNYVPDSGDQVSTSKCNTQCPGYPSDLCGGDGLWGYMSLSASPSGTSGGTSPTSATSTTDSARATETKNETVQDTATSIVTPSTSSSSSTSMKPTTKSSSSSSSSSTSSKSTITGGTTSSIPVTNTISTVVTSGGRVITVTQVTTSQIVTVIATASAGSAGHSSGGGGLSTGGAVGLAVGLVVLFALAFGAAAFIWIRRRRRQREFDGKIDSPARRGSSSGMMQTPLSAETGTVSSNGFGPGRPTMEEGWGTDSNGRRRSLLRPMDPRMDPSAAVMYNNENGSHDSINTLRDDQDYSRKVHQPNRVMRVTNPDPEDDNN